MHDAMHLHHLPRSVALGGDCLGSLVLLSGLQSGTWRIQSSGERPGFCQGATRVRSGLPRRTISVRLLCNHWGRHRMTRRAHLFAELFGGPYSRVILVPPAAAVLLRADRLVHHLIIFRSPATFGSVKGQLLQLWRIECVWRSGMRSPCPTGIFTRQDASLPLALLMRSTLSLLLLSC